MHKKIGILSVMYSSDHYGHIYGNSLNYIKLFQQYGKVYHVTPDQDPEDMKLDMLVLPGGPDISMALQGDQKLYPYGQGKDMPTYTYFFKNKLQKWIDSGTPIFGICLGMQALNNHFGGSITHHGHGHQISKEHEVFTIADTKVESKVSLHSTNSRHHQFIRCGEGETQLAENLVPLAYGFSHQGYIPSEKSGKGKFQNYLDRLLEASKNNFEGMSDICNVEAYRHKTLKIAGVQWHPEDMLFLAYDFGDQLAISIIEWLLDDNGNQEVQLPEPAPQVMQAKS